MTDRYERTRDAEAVAWFPTNAQGEIIRNYGDGSPVYAYRTKEEAEQAKRCHLGATGPVIPLYAAPQQEQAAAEDMGGFTSDTAALAFLHLIGNGNPNVERAVERLRQSLIAQQPAAVGEAMELVRDIAGQKPEKPDYWSSCGQCESNIGRAREVLESFIAAQQTAAPSAPVGVETYDRKQIAWRLERTAMGDGYYGDALRAAKDFPEATPSVRSLLDRWATGKERGLSDRIDLCAFAVKIYAADRSAPVGTKPLSEFMAEQEALHPDIRDKVQAAADELRASLAQQQEDGRGQ